MLTKYPLLELKIHLKDALHEIDKKIFARPQNFKILPIFGILSLAKKFATGFIMLLNKILNIG